MSGRYRVPLGLAVFKELFFLHRALKALLHPQFHRFRKHLVSAQRGEDSAMATQQGSGVTRRRYLVLCPGLRGGDCLSESRE